MAKVVEVKEGCIFGYLGSHQNLTENGKIGIETENRVFRFYFDDVEEQNLNIVKKDENNMFVEMRFEAGIDDAGNEFPETNMRFLISRSKKGIRFFVDEIRAEDVPNADMVKHVSEYDVEEKPVFITRDKNNIELTENDDLIDTLFRQNGERV